MEDLDFFLCAINITNGFQKIVDESNHKPNKMWVKAASFTIDR